MTTAWRQRRRAVRTAAVVELSFGFPITTTTSGGRAARCAWVGPVVSAMTGTPVMSSIAAATASPIRRR
jgi:hypothetical protein